MEEQKGFFGVLERYLMGPMGKIAQYKVVRAITAAGMAAVVLIEKKQKHNRFCFLCLS